MVEWWEPHTEPHSLYKLRPSARADRKTLTEAYLEYTHTVILVTDGEVVRGR